MPYRKQIWCDVHTGGGGFFLVGMKDGPKSWTVPSNSDPVDPEGPAHWASNLGDTDILDFGIQFSSNNSFEGTKAHWYNFSHCSKFAPLDIPLEITFFVHSTGFDNFVTSERK